MKLNANLQDGSEEVALMKLATGTTLPSHQDWGGEEIFVLEGIKSLCS